MHTATLPAVGALVAAHGTSHAFAAGDVLFLEGDRSRSVYVCVEGRVRVFLTLPSGKELLLGIKMPGDEFGELSAIDGRPRSASAVAMEPTVVAKMPGNEFLDELMRCPALAAEVLRNLADRIRRVNARLSARSAESTAVRTGHLLVELSTLVVKHRATDDRTSSCRVELAITQHDLADWIGATREATSRALATFRQAGLVETSRGVITVNDVDGLLEAVRSV